MQPYWAVHYEACTHLHRSLQNKIVWHESGGCIESHTPVHVLRYYHDIDLVCLMG